MILAFIFPTYNESLTLPKTLKQLEPYLSEKDLVIVADDSNVKERSLIEKEVLMYSNAILLCGDHKGGRGAAVWRGMEWIMHNRPDVTHVVEADCDGSHRVSDIIQLTNVDENMAFVIGSRYLSTSKIIGWSASRKFLSSILNKVIPRLLKLQVSDITNGLRRYSMNAVKHLVATKPENRGFIYLSEQALVLKAQGISANEIPIIFEPRFAGESSVTKKDLLDSLKGLGIILNMRKQSDELK